MAKQKREQYFYNPLDLDRDIAIGVKLKFGSNQTNVPYTNTAASSSMDPTENSTFSLFESSYSTEEQAHSNLFSLLLTRKGERVMHPEFGIGIHYYLFESISAEILEVIREDIRTEINYWLPYIIMNKIIVDFNPDQYLLKIELTYKITSNGAENSIVLFVTETVNTLV